MSSSRANIENTVVMLKGYKNVMWDLRKKFRKLFLFYQIKGIERYAVAEAKSDMVVLLRLDAIGDFIMSYSVFLQYRKFYRDKKIILICSTACKILADAWNIADEVLEVDVKRYGNQASYRNFINETLRNLCPGLVIQMVTYRSIEMECIAGMIPCKTKIAFSKAHEKGIFQSKRLDGVYNILLSCDDTNVFEIKKNFDLYNAITKSSIVPHQMLLPDFQSDFYIEDQYFVAAPGGSFRAKKWNNEKYVSVINSLLEEQRMHCIILGDAGDAEDNEAICKGVWSSKYVMNLTGRTTILDCIEIIRRAQFLITNDTCFAHIAVAVNTQSVCIVGGWHWGRFLPYDIQDTTEIYHFPSIAYHKMNCYGCNFCKKKCRRIKSQKNEEEKLACVQNVSVDRVMKLVSEISSVSENRDSMEVRDE